MRNLMLAAVAVAGLLGSAADAAVTVFTSRAAFAAATSGTTTETFNGFTQDRAITTAGTRVSPTFVASVSADSTSNTRIDVGPNVFNYTGTGNTPYLLAQLVDLGSTLTLTFDAPITAFGADFDDLNNITPGGVARSRFYIGETEVFPPLVSTVNARTFFGATSTEAFSSIRIVTSTNQIEAFGMDDVTTQVATTAAVPEPATWAMFIGGFGLVGGALRRRKATPALA